MNAIVSAVRGWLVPAMLGLAWAGITASAIASLARFPITEPRVGQQEVQILFELPATPDALQPHEQPPRPPPQKGCSENTLCWT